MSLSATARAQAYPSRPVRVVVGAVPGSAPDVIARLVADWLSRRLGQAFFVENRNGASGNLAAQDVAGAAPDGYTLLLTSAGNAINVTLYENLKFNLLNDFAPVAGVVSFPMVMTVSAALPIKTLPELIARAKENPGKINIGTPGIGSPQHVGGELFKMMTGANIVLVPYRGGPPAITDALSGQIQGAIGTVLLTIDHIRSGGLRALAVTGTARSELLPDVPMVADFVPGFEASQWIGIAAPKNTPADIVERLNREINNGLADSEIKTKIANLGGTVISGTPAAFGKFTADEVAKWGKVIKFANIKPD
ncbi:MAG TPA: tripartite tricarboxylate transporter substrate binding protein [Xanthobacteraceae bacterium]|nr:tripartite tricarboxylate transporter substrate binding protein [Xanthobacteraceae bacterium]